MKRSRLKVVFTIVFILSGACLLMGLLKDFEDDKALKQQQNALQEEMQMTTETEDFVAVEELVEPIMLPEYESLWSQNEDFAGWLRIEGTVIDYPVMQCLEDENYYLTRDFYKEDNSNGCLILDNDSNPGVGTEKQEYANGSKPSTNLIIHGHTMKSGQMFGNLMLYAEEDYGLSHSIICFDSFTPVFTLIQLSH